MNRYMNELLLWRLVVVVVGSLVLECAGARIVEVGSLVVVVVRIGSVRPVAGGTDEGSVVDMCWVVVLVVVVVVGVVVVVIVGVVVVVVVVVAGCLLVVAVWPLLGRHCVPLPWSLVDDPMTDRA